MYNVSRPDEQICVYPAQQFVSGQPVAMQMVAPDVSSAFFGSEAENTVAPGLQEARSTSRVSEVVYQQISPDFQQAALTPRAFAELYQRNPLSSRQAPISGASAAVHQQIPPGFQQAEPTSRAFAELYQRNPLSSRQGPILQASTNVHQQNPLGSRAGSDFRASAGVSQQNPLSSRQRSVSGAASSTYQRDPLSLLRAGPASRVSTGTHQQNLPGLQQAGIPSGGSADVHPLNSPSKASAGLQQQYSSMSYVAILPNAGTTTTDVSGVIEHKPYPQETLDEMWIDYQKQLTDLFKEIEHGSLRNAAEALLHISEWLLSHVLELDLNHDHETLHNSRLKLWQNFNHAWLALGQRQTDIMETGQQSSNWQDLMPKETIKQLGDKLVRLCDRLQYYGLIDYEYGVWEERIIDSFLVILDLYESFEGATGGSSSKSP